jgi:hypothetical protein
MILFYFRTAGEVVKRWVNEVQESIREGKKIFSVFERETGGCL